LQKGNGRQKERMINRGGSCGLKDNQKKKEKKVMERNNDMEEEKVMEKKKRIRNGCKRTER